MQSITAIIKVVSTCNLACSYCYATDRLGRVRPETIMTRDTLKRVVQELARVGEKAVHFIWHGGEPLLAGKDFFEEVIALQKEYCRSNQRVRNSIQTNAVLLTQDWGKFFAENKFNVGVSLDGPSEIHNELRRFGSGKASFKQVRRGVEYLREQDVSFGILAVVSKRSLPYSDEIFDFFVENNLKNYDLLPYTEFCGTARKLSPYAITPTEYGDFMIKVFDRWLEHDDPEIKIRFFENAMAGLLGGRPSTCTFAGTCADYFSIASNGDVYHCDWFIGQPEKRFGNINEESLDTIVAKPKYLIYVESIRQPKEECKPCTWKPICNGGCSYHRDIQGDFQSPYYFCHSRKLIFSHMNSRIQPVLVELEVSDRPQWLQPVDELDITTGPLPNGNNQQYLIPLKVL